MMRSVKLRMFFVIMTLMSTMFPAANAAVGDSDNGYFNDEWYLDLNTIYGWGYFGATPGIANLPGVNSKGGEAISDIEIITGSDGYYSHVNPANTAPGLWRVIDSKGNVEWYRNTLSDESRGSVALADINNDGNIEIAGSTTSGKSVEIMDRFGNFTWTFPDGPKKGILMAGGFEFPSSPAVADLNSGVSGLEVVSVHRPTGTIIVFDGDNSDNINVGITFSGLTGYTWSGTEGIDWDVLWTFTMGGNNNHGSVAIGDVDNDGSLEVVAGSQGGKVYVLNGASGALETTFTTGPIQSSPALANIDADNDLEIVIGDLAGTLYVLDWNGVTATQEASVNLGSAIYSSASIGNIDSDGGLEIVIGTSSGKVYAFNAGLTQQWVYPSSGSAGLFYASPSLANLTNSTPYDVEWQMFRHDAKRTGYYGATSNPLDVVIGSMDGYLYLIKGADGKIIDRFMSSGPIHGSPTVGDIDGDGKINILFQSWGGSTTNYDRLWNLELFPSFAAPGNVTIIITKFEDLNVNGIQDPGEPKLQNWNFSVIDNNSNGVCAGITDVNGTFICQILNTSINPPPYTITETLKPGWINTTVNPGVLIPPFFSPVNIRFGNVRTGEISGTKFNDTNGNGVKDNGETGVSGVTINLNLLLMPGFQQFIANVVTDGNGNYNFTGLLPGYYVVKEILPPNTIQTFPANGSPHFIKLISGQIKTNINFGNTQLPPSEIHGIKYNDTNGNGVLDVGEPGMPNITICLYPTWGCILTDNSGNFSFANVSPGNYTLHEYVPWNFEATTPAQVNILVGSGEVKVVNFGNYLPVPPPPDVSIVGDIIGKLKDVPIVRRSANLTIAKDLTSIGTNVVSVKLIINFSDGTSKTANMAKIGSTNVWSAVVSGPFPRGVAHVRFEVDVTPAGQGPEDVIQVGDIIFRDPSGVIKDICTGNPINNSMATLLEEYPPGSDGFILSPPDNHIPVDNPLVTGIDGVYGWMTVPGTFKVKGEMQGYFTSESPPVTVPPEVYNLNLSLIPIEYILPMVYPLYSTDNCGIKKIRVSDVINAVITVEGFPLTPTNPGNSPQDYNITITTPAKKTVNYARAKINQYQTSSYRITTTDLAGNTVSACPLFLELSREEGKPVSFNGSLLETEYKFNINNDGVTNIQINLNGNQIKLRSHPVKRGQEGDTYFIPEYGEYDIDLSPYMVEGDNNIALEARGKPGGNADIVISE